ncbi:MAG: hypothetical protein BGO34_08070 [Bacteroidia bacterium 44-10]|nr:MAG: hypothetical protein BGO34_08070 [Bacteroidia bacterium 44-10]
MRVIYKYLFLLLFTILLATSCNLLEPVDDNHSTFERVLNDPSFAEGLLVTGYTRIPTNSYSFNDVATDDAVSNDKLNNYLRMATGQWSSTFDPMNQWSNCLYGIQSVNQFISIIDTVNWRPSIPEMNDLYKKRFKGEAFGVRALLKYHLLVTVAGESTSGQLLGIPLLDGFLENNADFNIPRSSFTESVNSIYKDIEEAEKYLTMDDYKDISNATSLPLGYENVSIVNYNTIFGNQTVQRISGRILKALKVRVALLAASPAYANSTALWETAAIYAGDLLKTINGPTGLDPNGHRFYVKSLVDALNLAGTPSIDQAEMIWRSRRTASNSRESNHFPPTLFGSGRLNPTQNIVDAFPMKNGYPITSSNSLYDPANPYANRDPRLGLYVLYNGSTYKGNVILTSIGGKENAKDSISTSTRTGYYLKKLLVEEVSLNPAGPSTHNHYEVHMRYTEFFLAYAEAANEAWGPDGDNRGFGFTARDVIRAIRKRAGIDQPDTYLDGITTKEDMRKLIRSERRLELCFEGFRFWDLRRWKENITEPAKGVEINSNATEYKYVDVEQRLYRDYMYSGPIPNQDIIKYNNLEQNKGW